MTTRRIGLSKTRPASEARPLGTTRPKPSATNRSGRKSLETQKKVDTGSAAVVSFPTSRELAEQVAPAVNSSTGEKKKMASISLKGLSRNGKSAIYQVGRNTLRIGVKAFAGGQPPQQLEVAEGTFAEAPTPKSKMTPEERKAANANKPKLTLAQRAENARKRYEALQAKIQADERTAAEQGSFQSAEL
jgi:hypothetical protein